MSDGQVVAWYYSSATGKQPCAVSSLGNASGREKHVCPELWANPETSRVSSRKGRITIYETLS